MNIPFTRRPAWPPIRAGAFAATMATEGDVPDGCAVALLGLPDDTGVRLNGGRPGAAEGPAAFRAALARFGTTFDLVADKSLDVPVFDAGDVEPAPGGDEASLKETHARVEAAVGALRARGLVTFGVGGGHDLTLPVLAAVARSRRHALGGVNLDAHLDVRAKVGSGMPFRQLILGGHVDPQAFVEYGLGRFANNADDVAWARGQGVTLIPVEDILAGGAGIDVAPLLDRALAPGAGFVSIDLDGLDAAFAPGVSALNPAGLDVRHAIRLVEAAGRDARIVHVDVMELCPPHDIEGRTARTAALLFLSFIAGFASRPRSRSGPP
jgi:formiminoglutamase